MPLKNDGFFCVSMRAEPVNEYIISSRKQATTTFSGSVFEDKDCFQLLIRLRQDENTYFGLKVDVWHNKTTYSYVFGFLRFIKPEFDYNEIALFLDDRLIMHLRNVNSLPCIRDSESVSC